MTGRRTTKRDAEEMRRKMGVDAAIAQAKVSDTRDVKIYGYGKRDRAGLSTVALEENDFKHVPMNNNVTDPGSHFSGGYYVASAAGRHFAWAGLRFQGLAGFDVLALWFTKNEVNWIEAGWNAVPTGQASATLNGTETFWLEVGDKIGVSAYYFGGASNPRIAASDRSYLTVMLGGV